LSALTLPVFAAKNVHPNILTFDAPRADTTANDFNGTIPTGINDLGEITGYYFDASGLQHRFLRGADPNQDIKTLSTSGMGSPQFVLTVSTST
jgi:hypothetical protein